MPDYICFKHHKDWNIFTGLITYWCKQGSVIPCLWFQQRMYSKCIALVGSKCCVKGNYCKWWSCNMWPLMEILLALLALVSIIVPSSVTTIWIGANGAIRPPTSYENTKWSLTYPTAILWQGCSFLCTVSVLLLKHLCLRQHTAPQLNTESVNKTCCISCRAGSQGIPKTSLRITLKCKSYYYKKALTWQMQLCEAGGRKSGEICVFFFYMCKWMCI